MSQLTWEQVLARTDLVGGDFESCESGRYYRGPLIAIRRSGTSIFFDGSWCARLDPEEDRWKYFQGSQLSVDADAVTPQDIGDGRVFFVLPFLGSCTLFPVGGSKLDPADVEGFPPGEPTPESQ